MHSHTATNTLSVIQVTTKKFSQTDKIFRVVIDSAKDIAKARRLGAVLSTSYFALNLQLSVTHAIGFRSTQNLANEYPTRKFLGVL